MKIAPSVLNANFSCFQAEIDTLKKADRIHLDIMDGNYVPAISFGAEIFSGINFNGVPTEAHLMVRRPENFFEGFAALGVLGITFHIEVVEQKEAVRLLKKLKNLELKAGIAVDLQTSPEILTDEILVLSDQILVMSVQAGKGGQSFQPKALEKVLQIRARNFRGEIEIDGGVSEKNWDEVRESGVDIAVMGSALMRKSPEERIKFMNQLSCGTPFKAPLKNAVQRKIPRFLE